MQTAYWSVILSLLFICNVTSKRGTQCTRPGGCGHQRVSHHPAAGRMALRSRSKPKQFQHHRKPAHLSRSSTHYNNTNSTTRSTDTKQSFYDVYFKAVEALTKDMIVALMLKEGSIGLYLNEYRDSITKTLSRLESLTKSWTTEPVSVPDFLNNMSLTLDDLKLGSEAIKDDLIRLHKLVTDPSDPSTTVTRLHYKSKHIEDAKIAKDLREGLDTGRYFFSDLDGEANVFTKISESSSRQLCSNESSTSKCNNARISEYDWWSPIIGVKDHLKYADLWMIFLEELNLKLESIEFQIQQKKRSPGEFSIWFEKNNITSKNIMEALDLMVKEYNLYSIRANIAEMAATVNDNRLQYLTDLLRIFLKVKSKCAVKNNVAYVGSPYLLMSQVINCTRMLTMINSNISNVAVIASARFYIDDDFMASSIRSPQLELGKIIQMVIISPEWTVVGGFMRNIDLTGRQPPDYKDLSKTEGEPGLPGEQGGRFIAFLGYISAGDLTIVLNGGVGGNGQSGAHKELCIMGCFEEEEIPDDNEYCCQGRKVSQWLRGVHGGQKGKGGLAGDYETFIFARNATEHQILFTQNPGAEGEVGSGGKFFTVPDGFSCSGDTNAESGIFIHDNPFRYCHDKNHPEIHVVKPLDLEKRNMLQGHPGNSTIKPMDPIKIPFDPQKAVRATVRYKNWTRKHLHLFNAPKIYNFVSNIDFNGTIRNLYSPVDLIEEFNNLGKEPIQEYLSRELLKLSYQSLAVRAQARAQTYTTGDDNNKEDHIKLLLFLSAAARSKMLAVSYPFEPIFIVNMKDFLTLEKKRISDLKAAMEEQAQFEQLRIIVSDYNAIVQKRFKDAVYFTNSTINPELDGIQMKLGQFTKDSLAKMKRLKQNSDFEGLRAERKLFESHITGNLAWGVLKSIGTAVNVLLPVGDAINAGVDFVNSIVNPNPDTPPVMPVMIPDAVASGCSSAALSFRKSINYTIQGFKRQVEAVKSTLSAHAQVFPTALETLKSIKAADYFGEGADPAAPMDNFPPADCILSYKRLLTIETMIKEAQRNVSAAIKLDESNADSGALQPAAEALEIASAIIKATASTFNQWEQEDKGNVEEVTKAIQSSEERSRVLENQINRIETEMLPEMNDLFRSLSDERQDLHGQFSVALLAIRHRMQSAVRDIQIEFRQALVEGTGLKVYFERVLQSLEDAVDTLTMVYERIDAYQQQANLANFTAQVALHPEQYLGKLKDQTLQKKLDVLKFTLQGQVLLKRQSLVEGAFRMWNFPIVEPALCDFKNLSTTSLDFSTHENVLKFLTDIEMRLVNLIEIINVGTGGTGVGGKYIIKAEFIHKEQERGYPFYKWANSSFSEFITSILAGEPTFLHSEHIPGPPTCEAIKVTKLILAFGSVYGNLGEERDLANLLNRYTLSLTHGGNSFYLFANQTFVIPGETVEFYFSFDIGEDGLPRIHNQAYDKLLSGDLTISPYSTWGIHIQPIDPNQGFEPLAKYVNKFDLYLDGYGLCVRKSFAVEGDYVSPTCEVIK